ncbi:MAG: hypothetical protein R6W91_06660 [Thermoplasmata archaeon]
MSPDEDETDGNTLRERIRNFPRRKAAWCLITAIFLVSLSFSAMSAQNYTDIAKAKALTYIETSESAAFELDGDGNLERVNITMRFNVVNPSGKDIKVWIITYKNWIRDPALEDGIETDRWMSSGRMTVNGTYQVYYPVITEPFSFDAPAIIIPAMSNATITRHIALERAEHPDVLADLESIYDYSMETERDIEWMHYSSSILFIEGIPPYSGPDNDANLIRTYEGEDITPGIVGVGS